MSAPVPLPHISEIELARQTCRESFLAFVKHFWRIVPGAGRLQWNWHIGVYCDELQKMAQRVFAGQPREYDLVMNVPFGTSKSTVFSILFPCWTWTRMPTARHITATHTQSLVLDFSWKSRQVLQSEHYRTLYPEVELTRDSGEFYSNTLGGERRGVTVGGKTPMGFHAHFLGVDDPLDPQGARSEAELENASRFMTEVLPSRVTDKQVSVTTLVMQRLHHRDPTAVMLNIGCQEGAVPVRHVCLPGEESDDVNPPELRTRYLNGLLDPRRLPRTELKRYQVTLGAYGYAAQVMQNPIPPGGGMFKPQYFNQRVKAAPMHATRVLYADRASTQDAGCYTAVTLMAKDQDGNYYVEHVVHGQWEPNERNNRILAEARRCRTRYGKYEPTIVVEDEGGSTSKDANRMLAKVLAGFNVRFEHPTGSKDVRAEPWSAQLAAGNVYMVEDGWDLNGYIQEHCLFKPEAGKRLGKYKDQVDASSAAFSYLVGSQAPVGVMRILRERGDKTRFRVILLTLEELQQISIEDPCLLVCFLDPLAEAVLPSHGLGNLAGSLVLQPAPLDPAEYQERWTDLVQPWGKPPAELIFTQDHGKRFWGFFNRRRDRPLGIWVLAGNERLTVSAALAVCDCLGQPRAAIYQPADSDIVWGADARPPVQAVYDVVKLTRGMVV